MYENIFLNYIFERPQKKLFVISKKRMTEKKGILVQLCTQNVICQQKVICQKYFYAICNLFLWSHLISVCSGKKSVDIYLTVCALSDFVSIYIYLT